MIVIAQGFTPVHCGGTRATVGTTLGAVQLRTTGSRIHARSLEAIIAIEGPNRVIAGWLGIDNIGHPWVQFASGSPLRELFKNDVVGFKNALMSPMKSDAIVLPPGYELVGCEFLNH
jgi:hypothetical protein